MSEYEDYPVVMTHPHHRRSERIPIPGTERMVNGVMTPDYRGTPELLPPVTAPDAMWEEKYRAEGYERAGHGDPHAYSVAVNDAPDPAWMPQEYPKYVGDRIVNSKEEEAALHPSEPLAVPSTPSQRAEPPQGAPASEASAPTDQSAEIEALKAQIAALTQRLAPLSGTIPADSLVKIEANIAASNALSPHIAALGEQIAAEAKARRSEKAKAAWARRKAKADA